jgi:hypothetical protein
MKHDIKKQSNGSDFKYTSYRGKIVDVNDPLRQGRCKVEVFGIFDNLPIESIPWAMPFQKSTFFGKAGNAGSISIPKNGSVVSVRFNDGDIYSPEYEQIQELAEDLKSELLKSTAYEYEGSHYILIDGDEQLKIWFTRERGLTLELKDSYININQDSKIEIYHKDGLSSIELDGNVITVMSQSEVNVISNSITTTAAKVHIDGESTRLGASSVVESAVMGDSLIAALTGLAAMVDAKYPVTAAAAQSYINNIKDLVLSETVTIGR